MQFLARHRELERLHRVAAADESALVVVWGRRRIGKTRLLLEWLEGTQGCYWVADQSSAEIQRQYLAQQLASVLPGFADVRYGDWPALLSRLVADAELRRWRGPLVIDELPYLVQSSPELPSVLQRFVDHDFKRTGLLVALSGSSRRTMQGAALDRDAPLFGRAKEILSLSGLPPICLRAALGLKRAQDVVTAFALWGGIPHYWELAAADGASLVDAVDRLVLDPLGPLHEEPRRLLLEERAIPTRPCLDAIGAGVHRPSEIAGRVGIKATSLSKPLGQLIELGFIERELPFDAPLRGSKRALYKIADPFLRLWFSVVAPRRSALAQLAPRARRRLLESSLSHIVAQTWEDLCRRAVPALQLDKPYLAASRFWHGAGPEWDVVAWSEDRSSLLVGEAKWSPRAPSASSVMAAARRLLAKGSPLATVDSARLTSVLFVSERPKGKLELPAGVQLIDAETVLEALDR